MNTSDCLQNRSLKGRFISDSEEKSTEGTWTKDEKED